MTGRQPVETKNLDRYGHEALPWSRPRDLLAAGPLKEDVATFLGTSGADGKTHSAGIGLCWLDDEFYFTSGPGTRKSRHLAVNPACTISIRLATLDLVLEGEALRVTDKPTLDRVVEGFRAGGWPAEVEGDAFTAPFSAPSAGPPPWYLYRFTVDTAFGVATTEPHGATRWRFEP